MDHYSPLPNPALDSLTNQANMLAYAIQQQQHPAIIEGRLDQLIRFWRAQKVQP